MVFCLRLRIKGSVTFLYYLSFTVELTGGLQLSTKAKVMSSIPLGHVFFATLIPSLLARSPYGGTLLSTHMTHATATHKQ
jgi:hypothetical protein